MRAVVQCVSEARVTVEGETVGSIGKGYLILLGVGADDTEEQAAKLWRKAMMDVSLVNRGPFTIWLDTDTL